MSDLAKRQGTPLATKVEVEVLTKADPIPGLLRMARAIVQRTPELRAVFAMARNEGWDAERLADALATALSPYFSGPVSEESQNIQAVAAYLADEYLQVGDSILLISSQTGRAIARLRDEDFYQPLPVPREDGTMVTPGKRIRPDVEAFIIQWQFDRGYEEAAKQAVLAKLLQTQLLQEAGDRRVLYATRQGRKVLVSEMRQHLPNIIPNYCKGVMGKLFDHLPIVKEEPKDPALTSLGEFVNHARATYPLQDKRAKNLRHDAWTSILATTASGWVRSLAGYLLSAGHGEGYGSVPLGYLSGTDSEGLWITSANVSVALTNMRSEMNVLSVNTDGDFALCLEGQCGCLLIEETGYELQGREIFDRWDIASTFKVRVWIDWSRVRRYLLSDVPVTGLSFEVT
jgi:hypothetical protein